MCLRLLLTHCSAAGTVLTTVPGSSYESPKGYIAPKLWFTREASRWRAKESAMSLCLLPAKKQSGINRELWLQAHQSGQEAPSSTENTEIIFSPPILQACCHAQKGSSHLPGIPPLYFFTEINPFVITNESPPHADEWCMGAFTRGWQERMRTGSRRGCGLLLSINKCRYISFLPIPFTLLTGNSLIVWQCKVTGWFLSIFKVAQDSHVKVPF